MTCKSKQEINTSKGRLARAIISDDIDDLRWGGLSPQEVQRTAWIGAPRRST